MKHRPNSVFRNNLLRHSALIAPALIMGLLPMAALAQDPAAETPEPPPPQVEPAEPPPPAVEEIVVQGAFVPQEKRDTSEIANVLDLDDLERTGDANIALSLRRVTGISLVDGGFIYVRGLGERYSQTLLNGVSLPSVDPLQRVLPLDIFPNQLLSGVLVQKTYSPEYPLDFGGGLVALRTRTTPEERILEVSASAGFNTASTFEDGLRYVGGNWDWLGVDFGYRDLPSQLEGRDASELSPSELEAAAQAFPNVWSIDSEMNPPDVGLGLTYGDSFDLANEWRLGVLLSTEYDSSWFQRDGIRNTFTILGDGSLEPDEVLSPEGCREVAGIDAEDCGFSSTEWTIALNSMLQLGLEFDDNNSLSYTTLLLRESTREAIIQQGRFTARPEDVEQASRIDWVEQQLWVNILAGEHYVRLLDADGFDDTLINWRLSASTGDREVPLRREYTYQYDVGDQVFRLFNRADSVNTTVNDLDDSRFEGGFDLEQPIDFDNFGLTLETGFSYIDTERDSTSRTFAFDNPAITNPLVFQELLTRVPEIVCSDANIGPDGFRLREITDPSNQLTAEEEYIQAYGAIEAQITPTFRVAAGGRFESSEQIVQSFARADLRIDGELVARAGDPLTTVVDGEFFLPAVTATWEFLPNQQVRAGFSQTISRPSLREVSPALYLSQERDFLVAGNPRLQIAEVDNYDLRYEWYFAQDQFLTLGLFYKEFTNPIEQVLGLFGEGALRTFDNADSAELMGGEAEIEIEVPVRDWFDVEWLQSKDFITKANFTYIDSEITLPDDPTFVQTDDVRRLQGQSDILLNFEFGYEDFEARERAFLLLNYTSDRIQDVGIQGQPNFIEEPPVLLDFVYAREVTMFDADWEFSFEARNLLNDDFTITQGGRTAEQYDLGRTFPFGIRARF